MEVLKSNLCDYNDAYILIIGYMTVVVAPATQVSFKNCAPFIKCIKKIDWKTIGDAEDLDLVMPMYNLIEYILIYSERAGSLRFYSKDEATDFKADIANDNNFKSFKYKAKLLGNTEAHPSPFISKGFIKNVTIAVSLKYLSNFWISLELPLINCIVELKLKWTKHCVLYAGSNDDTNANPDNIVFTIKDTKLYVPIVTLSAKDNQNLLNLLNKGFERSVY